MKRRFASPLLLSHDSSLGEDYVSTFSKSDKCSSQSEIRRFTSPLLVNRDPEVDIGSISESKQFSSPSQLEDRRLEVPKTPTSLPKVESATRTVNRRLFHGSERHSQLSDILSSAPLRRTTPRPLAFEQANKRVCESRSDDLQRQVEGILEQSVDRLSSKGENLVLGTNAQPLRREPRYKSISGTTPSAGRGEEFSKPASNPSVCEKRTAFLSKRQARGLGYSDKDAGNGEVRQGEDLSYELLDQEIVQRTTTGAPAGSRDVSRLCVMSPETRPTLISDNICILEVLTCPSELKDVAALSCNRATLLDAVREGRFIACHAKDVNLPARSAQEAEVTNVCMKKLKDLLVPSSIPSAELNLQSCFPRSFLQVISALNAIYPCTSSSRDSIKEDIRSFEVVRRISLAENQSVNERADNSLLKTTRFLQEVPTENESHLACAPHMEDKNLNHHQRVPNGISKNSTAAIFSTPHKTTKSFESFACVHSPKDRLSPSSLYAAQSLEFRSIWFSKRLKMAEIADACLAQNEFLFSTLA